MKKSLIVLTTLFLAPTYSPAQFFGPRNYEDCVLQNIKTAKTDAAVSAVYSMCASKFSTSPTIDKKKDEARKRCKLDTEADARGVLIRGDSGIISEHKSKLRNLKISNTSHNSISIEFQNLNSFAVDGVSIGFGPKTNACKSELEHYAAVIYCGDYSGVPSGGYGSLPCQQEARHFVRKSYCLVAYKPRHNILTESFSEKLISIGLCQSNK